MVSKGSCDLCFEPLRGAHGVDYYEWQDCEDGLCKPCIDQLLASTGKLIPLEDVLRERAARQDN